MSQASNESREDYIESILILKRRKGAVRSIDIANYFGYSRPSVSRAVGILKKDGLIYVDANGYIELTVEGLRLAESVYDRHRTLSEFLDRIGVSADTAEKDACRIEHVVSQESMDRISEWISGENEQ
ncbi:MAG: metal-dependent transcriptional regulator [Clostridiales bacterium]|nr:metal-dependent transcriptional regulator [Clostridiales bacterium]